MGKKEGKRPAQHKKAPKLLEPKTLRWILVASFVGGGLSFACVFIAVSAGIVANFPAEPVYVEPAFPMSSASGIALVGLIGAIISMATFLGAGAILTVQHFSKQQTDATSQPEGKQGK